MLVAEDDNGIAWVSRYEERDGAGAIGLEFMAVHLRHRGLGGQVAREMFEATLQAIEQRAIDSGVRLVDVTGNVWHENRASQSMCASAGLKHVGWTKQPGVMVWATKMALGDVAFVGEP